MNGPNTESRIVPIEGPGPDRQRIVLEDGLLLRSSVATTVPQPRVADVVLCELPVRRTLRIVLDYAGSLRPFAWIQVGPDGSVYWGLSRSSSVVGRGFVEEGTPAFVDELTGGPR